MKKRLVSLLQLGIGIGLIAFLFHRMDNKADLINALQAIASNWPYLAGAILAFLVCILLCTWRWRLILAAHDMKLPVWRTLELYFIGQFFNAFMFGSIGGDLVKVFFVANAIPHKRTEAMTTVFIDRLMGLLALVTLIGAILIITHRQCDRVGVIVHIGVGWVLLNACACAIAEIPCPGRYNVRR